MMMMMNLIVILILIIYFLFIFFYYQFRLQCAGNRRNEMSKVRPVKGVGWDNQTLGNAVWTGVRLRHILQLAGVLSETLVSLSFVGFFFVFCFLLLFFFFFSQFLINLYYCVFLDYIYFQQTKGKTLNYTVFVFVFANLFYLYIFYFNYYDYYFEQGAQHVEFAGMEPLNELKSDVYRVSIPIGKAM